MKKILSFILSLIIVLTTFNGMTVSATETLENIALGCDYYFSQSPQSDYEDSGGELTDGNVGSSNFFDKSWVAWSGAQDGVMVNIVIDLGESRGFSNVEIVALNYESAGVFYPVGDVIVSCSDDDESYAAFGSELIPEDAPKNSTYTYNVQGEPQKARYIKVSFNAKTWVFISEISVTGYDGEIDPSEPSKPDIEVPDVMIRNGESLTISANQALTLEAEAWVEEGNLTYQWYKNGEAIDGASDKILTITKATFEDDGVYKFTAYNNVLNHTVSASAEIDVTVDGVATNIALGKSYEWLEPYLSAYKDTDNKELTDGNIPLTTSAYDNAYVGIGMSSPLSVVIDLGENGAYVTNVTAMFMANGGGDATRIPGEVTVSYSYDNVNYKEYGVWEHWDFDYKGIYAVSVENGEIRARYIKVETNPDENRGYDFISEIMVYGEEKDYSVIDSEKCGENATWEFYPNGTLHIGGSGDMYGYPGSDTPWYSKRDEIKYIVIDDGITSIGEMAFNNCKALESVDIGNTVKIIGDDAFFRCETIKEIVLPDSVTSIGEGAFSWCFALEDITLSQNLETIGDEAFSYCESLEKIIFPASVTSVGKKLFSYTDTLSVIVVDALNPVYYSKNNCLIEKATEKVVMGCRSSIIPYGVVTIGASAFEDCNALKEITIPATVKTIEEDAFLSSGIEILDIRDGVEVIGSCAFAECYYLTKVVIPGTVDSLWGATFSGCHNLSEIVIGSGVTEICNYAFADGMELTKITIPKTVKRIGVGAFGQRRNNACDVYYEGTEEDWNNITVEEENEFFDEYCTFHFETVQPVKVYGYMMAFGDSSTATIIELIKDGEVTNSVTMTGTKGDYVVENVKAGTYTLRASKRGYATREYEITVTNYDFYREVEIIKYGDVTGEGGIGNADVLQINRYNSNQKSVFDNDTEERKAYRLKVANVTGIVGNDDVINNVDALQINRMNANLPSVFDALV